jgi:hypothetical protein
MILLSYLIQGRRRWGEDQEGKLHPICQLVRFENLLPTALSIAPTSRSSYENPPCWVWTIKFLFSSHGPENNVRVRHLIITVFIIVCSSVRLSHCNSIQFNVLKYHFTISGCWIIGIMYCT